MGILSTGGEFAGRVIGTIGGIAGDITKTGISMLSKVFRAGDPPGSDIIGIDDGVKMASSAIDRTTGFVSDGLAKAGSAIGQSGDDMLMKLASPKTPAVPGFDKSNGIG